MTADTNSPPLQSACRSTTAHAAPLFKCLSLPECLPSPLPRPIRCPQYHYTSLEALDGILKEGAIKTCPHIVEEERLPEYDYELFTHLACVVAWTSSAPVWEPAAKATEKICRQRGYAIEYFVAGTMNPVARIEVDPDILFEWSHYLFMTGTSSEHLLGLAQCGYTIESDPDDWAVCPRPIPISRFRSIEIWNGDDWTPLSRSEDPVMATYQALDPCPCQSNAGGGLSAGGIWVKDVRDKGGVEWLDFLRAKYTFQLEAHMQGRDLTKGEIAKIVCHDESLHPVYRVLMAIQTLPDCCASRVVAEVADDAIKSLERNPLFARAVEKYCGLDQQTLIQVIRTYSSTR